MNTRNRCVCSHSKWPNINVAGKGLQAVINGNEAEMDETGSEVMEETQRCLI